MTGATFLLAACSQPAATQANGMAKTQEDVIACAHPRAPLASGCTVDRQVGATGTVLTIRHPDGAFRRFVLAKDGRGVIAADGAAPGRLTVTGANQIMLSLDGDRYVLPATLKRARP